MCPLVAVYGPAGMLRWEKGPQDMAYPAPPWTVSAVERSEGLLELDARSPALILATKPIKLGRDWDHTEQGPRVSPGPDPSKGLWRQQGHFSLHTSLLSS